MGIVTEERLLKQVVRDVYISNINNRFNNYIVSLKTMFVTSNNQQYLETWFKFLKMIFLQKI